MSRERDIGRPKLDAALEDLRAPNHHPEVTGDRRSVAGPEGLAMLLDSGPASYDLLVMCAPTSRPSR